MWVYNVECILDSIYNVKRGFNESTLYTTALDYDHADEIKKLKNQIKEKDEQRKLLIEKNESLEGIYIHMYCI